MRILLISPQSNYPRPTPCLDLFAQGPAYVAGALGKAGHQVAGVATSYEISSEPSPVVLERSIRRKVSDFQPDLIAIGGMAAEFLFLRDAIGFARSAAPHTPILLGGGILTNDKPAFEILKPDFGLMDEAELTSVELAAHLAAGTDPGSVAGLARWANGQAIYNPIAEPLEELDSLPYPDYEPLGIDDYLAMQNQTDNYFHVRTRTRPRMLPVLSGRSCPFKCTFCQYSTLEGSRRRYRGREMKAVVEEIAHFHGLYGVNIVKIYDDLFSVKEHRILEFCELMKASGLDISWNASMRVGDVTLDLLKAMKDAGCIHIGYGFESASDTVLASMNKRVTVADIQRAIDLSEEAGIGIQANFIYGDPAETLETAAETRAFYERRCLHHIVHNDYLMPYPGSPVFDHGRTVGAIPDKLLYYETIHQRPPYNMTKMSAAEFHRATFPAMSRNLQGLTFLRDPRFAEAAREGDFRHPYFDGKLLLEVAGECPHCGDEVVCIFPKPRTVFGADWSGLFPPIKFYCGHCHRRFLVSTLALCGIEDGMQDWLDAVGRLAAAGRPVVILPYPTPEFSDALEGYGFPLDALDIHSSIHLAALPTGLTWRGVPVRQLTAEDIGRFRQLDHVILPSPVSLRLAELLQSAQVTPERIHMVTEGPRLVPENASHLPMDRPVPAGEPPGDPRTRAAMGGLSRSRSYKI